MYQPHFGLNDRPFAFAPNPEHYYPASSIEQAREVIALNIERSSGATLVVGPVGSGKTLLCQLIANQFSGELPVCLILGSRMRTRESLLQTIAHGLGLPFRGQDEGELRIMLSDHVSGPACHRGVVLIIDEADRLPLELLEELRGLTNLVNDGQPQVRLLLAGAARLEERVGHPKLESLNQRIVGRLFLDNFSTDETADYIRARINACGGDADSIFCEDALATVYRATHGVPRLVNQICDHAMLIASVAQVDRLDKASIEEAWADLQQLPLPAATTRPAVADPDGSGAGADLTSNNESGDCVVEFGMLDESNADSDPTDQLDTIQRVVAELESEPSDGVDEEPKPSSESEEEVEAMTIDQAANPFAEVFDDEEVVIQQFVSPSKLARQGHESVTSAYSERLATQLTAAHPGLRMYPGVLESDSVSGLTEESEVDSSFQPLSAYTEDRADTPFDVQLANSDDVAFEPYPAAHDTFEHEHLIPDEDTQIVFEFGDHQFDPSSDPVLPEYAAETLATEIVLELNEGLASESRPEPDGGSGSGPEVAVVVQERVAAEPEDELSAQIHPIVFAQEADEPQPHAPLPRADRKFRTLFSRMRRA